MKYWNLYFFSFKIVHGDNSWSWGTEVYHFFWLNTLLFCPLVFLRYTFFMFFSFSQNPLYVFSLCFLIYFLPDTIWLLPRLWASQFYLVYLYCNIIIIKGKKKKLGISCVLVKEGSARLCCLAKTFTVLMC